MKPSRKPSPLVPLLAMRGPIRLVLRLLGWFAVFCAMLFAFGAVVMGHAPELWVMVILALAFWYLTFWLRHRYDSIVLKHVPPEQSLHLDI